MSSCSHAHFSDFCPWSLLWISGTCLFFRFSLSVSLTLLFPFLSPSLPKIPRCPYVEAQCYPVPLCQDLHFSPLHPIPRAWGLFSLFYVSFPWPRELIILLHLGAQDGGDENARKDIRVSAFTRVSRVDTEYWEFRLWTVVFKHVSISVAERRNMC